MATAGCAPEQPVEASPIRVQAAEPLVRDIDVTLTYPFEIEADRSVAITPVAINGFLTKVAVDVGDEVEAGDLIALVDCREYKAQSTQAETTIAKREARADESRSQLERLARMGDSLVAPAELERAQAEKRVAEAELADARAKLSEAQQRRGYCSLRAPFDGFVSERFLDPGAMVRPGGLPVINLVKTREVRGVTSVIESDAPKVLRGAAVEARLNAFPDTTYMATVARFGHSLDPDTRTMRVEMDLPNAAESLLPGMTGTANIVVGERKGALLIPVTAVLLLEDVAYAFVVREEGGKARAQRVEVELGVDLGDWVEVRTGVARDDRVIMVGRELVDDGTWIEVFAPGESLPAPPGGSRSVDEGDTDGAEAVQDTDTQAVETDTGETDTGETDTGETDTGETGDTGDTDGRGRDEADLAAAARGKRGGATKKSRDERAERSPAKPRPESRRARATPSGEAGPGPTVGPAPSPSPIPPTVAAPGTSSGTAADGAGP